MEAQKNQLDGKVLSTEEQNKFDAIKSFKEDIAYYQEAIKYLPEAYRVAAGYCMHSTLGLLSGTRDQPIWSSCSAQSLSRTCTEP